MLVCLLQVYSRHIFAGLFITNVYIRQFISPTKSCKCFRTNKHAVQIFGKKVWSLRLRLPSLQNFLQWCPFHPEWKIQIPDFSLSKTFQLRLHHIHCSCLTTYCKHSSFSAIRYKQTDQRKFKWFESIWTLTPARVFLLFSSSKMPCFWKVRRT